MSALPIPLLVLLLLVILLGSMALSYLLIKTVFSGLMGRIFGTFAGLMANRYLFSPRNRNAINIISLVAVTGVTFVTAALILVLSVFNGLEGMIEGMYTAWDADLRVIPATGKSLEESDSLRAVLARFPGVAHVAPVLEDQAMLTYNDKQQMVTLKGVPEDYLKINRLDTLIYEGEYNLAHDAPRSSIVLGGSVAYVVNANLADLVHPMRLWAATDKGNLVSDPLSAVRADSVYPAGFFMVQIDYDTRYVLADLDLAQHLFDKAGRISAWEIRVADFQTAEKMKPDLQAALGSKYQVESWFDQHAGLFAVMRNEKWVAYLILALMLLIAAVNIIGSLSMIVVEKTADIAILRTAGATPRMIRRIFLLEGAMVGGIGGLAGMLAALVTGLLQQHYGILRLNAGESFSNLEFFPVRLQGFDFAVMFFTVAAISLLAGLYPSRKAAETRIVTALRK